MEYKIDPHFVWNFKNLFVIVLENLPKTHTETNKKKTG